MSGTRSLLRSIGGPWFPILAALAIGFLGGSVLRGPVAVQAEIRRSPPRQSMLSGSERSETTLREISATLKRIDSRLQRFEKSMAAGNANVAPK